MGGVVGFTLREEDGSEHRMSRWTNWTPWAIDNINLVKKSPEHIEKILFEWKKYNNLPEEQKNEYWSYSSPYLAPAEYGLVVVDMLSNKILDCNGYHSFGFIDQITLTNEFHSTILDGGGYVMPGNDRMKAFTEDKGNTASRFYRFFKEKRIKDVLAWNEEKNKMCSLSLDVNSMNDQELAALMSSTVANRKINFDNQIIYAQYELDMSPFEVITFPESKQGFKNFHQAILDLGFSLSEKEEQIWEEYINEKFEEE